MPECDSTAAQVERATKSMTPATVWAAMRANSEKVSVYDLRWKSVCVTFRE